MTVYVLARECGITHDHIDEQWTNSEYLSFLAGRMAVLKEEEQQMERQRAKSTGGGGTRHISGSDFLAQHMER